MVSERVLTHNWTPARVMFVTPFQILPELHKLEGDWKIDILCELIGGVCSCCAANQSGVFEKLFFPNVVQTPKSSPVLLEVSSDSE